MTRITEEMIEAGADALLARGMASNLRNLRIVAGHVYRAMEAAKPKPDPTQLEQQVRAAIDGQNPAVEPKPVSPAPKNSTTMESAERKG